MPIFKIQNSKLVPIKTKSFDLERKIQDTVEKNLDVIFGLQFVKSEFQIRNFWIDTLAFDPESKSFVIIEYKKDKSFSVIDQGFAYLNLMLHNQADFILEYNEKLDSSLKRVDVDWSQSKVIFIAQAFTPYQVQAIGFKDLPMELWEVELYDNNLLSFNLLKSSEIKESIKSLGSKNKTISDVSKEVKTFSLEDHIKRGNKDTQTLFRILRDKIMTLDDRIIEKPVRDYIGYKVQWFNFVSIHIFRSKLKIYVRKNNLSKDASKKFTKVPSSYGWGKTPLWWIDISNSKDLNYIFDVIKESYESAPDK